MNSWQHSETRDEASDRALFAQRARALPAPAIPSLSAILAAVDAPAPSRESAAREAREDRTATVHRLERRRSWLPGLIAAAACMAALFGSRGRLTEPRSIVAEDDAGASRAGERWGASWAAAEVCVPEGEEARGLPAWGDAPFALASTLEPVGACVEPAVSFESSNLSMVSETELACHLGRP